jgi:hypothetical protein
MRVAVFVTALAFCCVAGVPAQGKASPSKFKLNGITWVFVEEHGAKVRETVDHDGNYVARTFVGKELDHGTAVMKGSKVCFTSEVDNSGEVCWTTRPLNIGQSMVSTSDKGEKLKVTRVKYVAMKPRK